MLGQIYGQLIARQPPQVLCQVEGTGLVLELEMPLQQALQLPLHTPLHLHSHFLWRNEQPTLFAFRLPEEKFLFKTLLKISGIGGKLALSILDQLPVNEFWQSIEKKDTARLCRVRGLGRKTADRLILDLSGTLPVSSSNLVHQEVAASLEALGFTKAEALARLQALPPEEKDVALLLQLALQYRPPSI
jgi:Holliday junction DNA helicase RuvA